MNPLFKIKDNQTTYGKLALYLFSIVIGGAFTCFTILKSQNGPIVLHDDPCTFKPHKFYIIDVADGRADRNVTAIMLVKGKGVSIKIDFKDGAVNGIKQFIDHNLHRDTTLKPVLLTIKEFKLVETPLPYGMVQGHLKIIFSYSSQLSYENKHLVDFSTAINYNRSINKNVDVEPYLRKGIKDGLTYFNNWSNKIKTF